MEVHVLQGERELAADNMSLGQFELTGITPQPRGEATVEIQYSRVVRPEGNPEARRRVAECFEPCDTEWRGLGIIPASGLRLRPEFAQFDASRFLPPMKETSTKHTLCECGSILKGQKSPSDCRAFGVACTPENPLGPCMVSNEGACAAEYRYSSLTLTHTRTRTRTRKPGELPGSA
jgi:hydrogenase expression/formation protein HypD